MSKIWRGGAEVLEKRHIIKQAAEEDHVTAFKKKDPQAIMISPYLDTFFSTNTINNSLCSPQTLFEVKNKENVL